MIYDHLKIGDKFKFVGHEYFSWRKCIWQKCEIFISTNSVHEQGALNLTRNICNANSIAITLCLGESVILIEDTELESNNCKCPINQLMLSGCKCGGK